MDTQNFSQKTNTTTKHTASLIVLLAVFITLHAVFTALFPQKGYADDLTIQNILTSINRERGVRNLVTLSTNGILSQAAQYKADDMQTRHYFAHVDPDGNYIWNKIVSLGYTPYSQLGENLAIDFYDTESLVDAWMQSPTHRANILNEGFRDQGMGLELGNTSLGQYGSAIANTFGTLAIKPATAQTAPVPTATAPKKTITKQTVPKATTTPQATSTPHPVLAVRGEETPSFQLPSQGQNTTTTATSSTESPSSEALIPQGAQYIAAKQITGSELNRYLSILFGIILLYILTKDIREFLKGNREHLDKKINNLVLLILSLIAVAVMYWL